MQRAAPRHLRRLIGSMCNHRDTLAPWVPFRPVLRRLVAAGRVQPAPELAQVGHSVEVRRIPLHLVLVAALDASLRPKRPKPCLGNPKKRCRR